MDSDYPAPEDTRRELVSLYWLYGGSRVFHPHGRFAPFAAALNTGGLAVVAENVLAPSYRCTLTEKGMHLARQATGRTVA